MMHRTVEVTYARSVALCQASLTVHLPHCSAYISKEDNNWWAAHERLFPKDSTFRTHSPVCSVARHSFIKQYYQQESKVEAMLRTATSGEILSVCRPCRVKDETHLNPPNFELRFDQREN